MNYLKVIIISIYIFIPNKSFASWLDNLFGSKYYYNVLFYTPTNKEIFLGTAKTVSDCQTMAFREADYKKMPADYMCCKTDGKSFCISKHR